jgi:Periplasmic copper-binding protein (NosD)
MEDNMGRRALGATLVAAIALLAIAGPAWATAKTVCSSHCSFTGIQEAINAATPGATITVGPGAYYENLTVDKAITLEGSGKRTIVYPGVSNPDACAESSLCGGDSSNIIMVGADNVTITKMRLEGDNPKLTSGKVVNGADIDARNGIITDQVRGYENLTVSHVTVADIFLRGIYAYEGTFDFTHNTVENVEGESSSIAMFGSHASGVFSENKVSEANDAISANWSRGIQFLDNTITKSESGIHTDNNGGEGGTADLIQGNKVKECTVNGYGIWVFAPYVSATVDANKISGCAIGLATFGGAVSGQGPTFSANDVNGTGATVSAGETVGDYITTDQLGFEFGNVTVHLTGNSIEHFGTGLYVTQTEPTPGQPEGGQATVTASNNAIARDTNGAFGGPGTVVNGANNWWGCKQGPNAGKCDSATGTVVFTPFLATKP